MPKKGVLSPGPLQDERRARERDNGQGSDILTITFPDIGQGDAVPVQAPNGCARIETHKITARTAIGEQSSIAEVV